MDNMLVFELLVRMCLVLLAASVAALALRRLIASTSRNRAIYGLVMVAAGTLAVVALADILAGSPMDFWLSLGCLLLPVCWRFVTWITWSARLNAQRVGYAGGVLRQPSTFMNAPVVGHPLTQEAARPDQATHRNALPQVVRFKHRSAPTTWGSPLPRTSLRNAEQDH